MSEIYIWVKNIFLMILGISFFQVLIPESSMKRYLKFLFSLLILAAILEPVSKLILQFS